MLAAKEMGAVELCVGGLRDMGRRGWGVCVEPDGGVPSKDEILRFRIWPDGKRSRSPDEDGTGESAVLRRD